MITESSYGGFKLLGDGSRDDFQGGWSGDKFGEQVLRSPEREDGCCFIERQFNIERVPSVVEVREFLGLFEWGSYWYCAFAVMFFAGLRPCEVSTLHTDDVIRDPKTGRWLGFNYRVGKPKADKKSEKGDRYVRKRNRIVSSRKDIPQELMDAFMHFWVNHRQSYGHFFPNFYSQYGKKFSIKRKQMVKLGYDSWANKKPEVYTNEKKGFLKDRGGYCITPYSGRRFFITFYYWCISPNLSSTSTPDQALSQRRVCHSGKNTTQIYIYPYPDLGVEREDARRGWDVLVGEQKEQTRLSNFF